MNSNYLLLKYSSHVRFDYQWLYNVLLAGSIGYPLFVDEYEKF